MKVVIATDSFKGSLTSIEASSAIEMGIKKVYHDAAVIKVPIADGGEGTVDSLILELGGEIIEKKVTGPLKKKVIAKYGILNDQTAVIEMATSSGLTLLKQTEMNPLKTTTYGFGELIKDAISKGSRKFILGIGGSATNDCGIGMLKALGYKFYDNTNHELAGIGESLTKIDRIDDTDKLNELAECQFLVACDVINPLYGVNGASYVYGRQKGANEEMIKVLDQGMINFSNIINKQFHKDISNLKGTGAAGGLGGGIFAFLNGKLFSGIDIIFSMIDIENKVKDADFLITGEGSLDGQSIMGKVSYGVAKLGKKHKIPVLAIAGSVKDNAYKLHNEGITSLFSIINYPMSLKEAMDKKRVTNYITQNITEIFRLIKSIKGE